MITYLSFLCARLLDLRKETRAARLIQTTWRQYKLKKDLKHHQVLLKNDVCVCVLSHSVVSNSLRPQWTVAHQAPLPMGFLKQEYWSGLLFPSGDLPHPGSNPYLSCLLHWQVDSLPLSHLGSPVSSEIL